MSEVFRFDVDKCFVRIQWHLVVLEPCAVKVASTVLRGEWSSNGLFLPSCIRHGARQEQFQYLAQVQKPGAAQCALALHDRK